MSLVWSLLEREHLASQGFDALGSASPGTTGMRFCPVAADIVANSIVTFAALQRF